MSRPMHCAACGSGRTEALGGEFCCLDCGAQTSFTGEVVRPPKTDAEKGGPNGQPMLHKVDAHALVTADWVFTDEPAYVPPAEKATKTTKKTAKKASK